MPPPPEFRDTLGEEGIVEILNKLEAQDPAQTNSHIRIAGEIEVDVQHERNRVHPEEQHRLFLRLPEQLAQQGKIVRQNDLFGKTYDEPPQTQSHLVPAMGTFVQLPGHIDITNNGAGDQLGKQRHISAEADGVLLGRNMAPVYIDGIAEALEGIEADAHRQRQPQQGHTKSGDSVERINEEVRILKQAQQGDADHHRNHQPELFHSLALSASDSQTAAVEQTDGKDHQP